MPGRFVRFFALTFCCAFLAIACTKKASKSKVTISLPQSQQSVSSSSCPPTCPQMVQHLIINVSGPELPAPIKYTWDAHQCPESATTCAPPNPIEIPDIPNGEGYLVQVLFIRGTEIENDGDFFYGDNAASLLTLNGGDAPVSITVSKINSTPTEMHGGSIAGRYYSLENTTTTVRTGGIVTKFAPPNGKPMMHVDYNEMFAGWFSVFALKNTPFVYELEGYGQMFGGPKSASSFTPVAGTIMVVDLPDAYRTWGDSSDYEHENPVPFTLGKFGEGTIPAMPDVCKDTSPYTYQYSFDAAPPGGTGIGFPSAFNFSAGANTCAGSTPFVDFLKFVPAMHDNNGKEKAAGFRGPFQAITSGSQEMLSYSGGTLTWKYLPGITSSHIDGVKIFARSNTSSFNGGHRDYEANNANGINCPGLGSLGFSQVASAAAPSESTSVNLSGFTNPTIIACPYKGARMFYSAVETGGYGGGGPMHQLGVKIIGSNMAQSYVFANGPTLGTGNHTMLKSAFLNNFHLLAIQAGSTMLRQADITSVLVSTDSGTTWSSPATVSNVSYTNGGLVGTVSVTSGPIGSALSGSPSADVTFRIRVTVPTSVKNQYNLPSEIYTSGDITLAGTTACAAPGSLQFYNTATNTVMADPLDGLTSDSVLPLKLRWSGCPGVYAPLDYSNISGSLFPQNCFGGQDIEFGGTDPFQFTISPKDMSGQNCTLTGVNMTFYAPSNAGADNAADSVSSGSIIHSTTPSRVGMLLSQNNLTTPGSDNLLLDMFALGPAKSLKLRSVYLNSDGKLTDSSAAGVPSAGDWSFSIAGLWASVAEFANRVGFSSVAAPGANSVNKINFTDSGSPAKTGFAYSLVRTVAQNRPVVAVSENTLDGGSPVLVLDNGTSLEVAYIPSNSGDYFGKSLHVLTSLPAGFTTNPVFVKVFVWHEGDSARVFLAATYTGYVSKYVFGITSGHNNQMTVNWAPVTSISDERVFDISMSKMTPVSPIVLAENTGTGQLTLGQLPTWDGSSWTPSASLTHQNAYSIGGIFTGSVISYARCGNDLFVVGTDASNRFAARRVNDNTSPAFITNVGSETHLSNLTTIPAGSKVTCHGIQMGPSSPAARVFLTYNPANSSQQDFHAFESGSPVCGGAANTSLSISGSYSYTATAGGLQQALGFNNPSGSGLLAAYDASATYPTRIDFVPLSCGTPGTINVGASANWGSLSQTAGTLRGIQKIQSWSDMSPDSTSTLSIFGQDHQFYWVRIK